MEKDGSIVDSDLEVYAKHLKNLSEDSEDTLWGPTEDACAEINSQLQDELTDMRVDLEAQSLFKCKNLRDSAM